MNPMINSFQKEFEDKILKLGYSFSFQEGGFYVLFEPNMTQFLGVRLIVSDHPNLLIYGSKNGMEIQGIGLFKLNHYRFDPGSDVYILMFQNSIKRRIECLIIPNDELMKMLNLRICDSERKKSLSLVFWLMPDNSIYRTTEISAEGEWYFLSGSDNGRMADETDMNCTRFLNNWNVLGL